MATPISFGLLNFLAALSGMEVEVHEKTEKFIVALSRAKIPVDCCLACNVQLVGATNWFGHAMPGQQWVGASKQQKAAFVAALVEAGVGIDEIRKLDWVEKKHREDFERSFRAPTEKEMLSGDWSLLGCKRVAETIAAVEKLHAGGDAE